MSLVVKESFMVCPNAWVCRLIVQVIFVPFSAIITKPLLLVGAAASPFGKEQKHCCIIDRHILISSNQLDPGEIKC